MRRYLMTRRRAASRGHDTPEELLLESEYRAVLEEGLSRVPPSYSIALRLASCEDRSMKEIAEYLGISYPQ